ncbi:MAG TPA: ABC transporter substrate-binding protein [Rhizomicrobium sp.]|jgi:NitT/TauT family transport system substrate-binding protein|nr:ABC transporter substrate-binding protein [Rhizomicrobium sp.]
MRILAIVAAALILTACGQEQSAPPKHASNGPTRIVFVTDWKAQAEHGGFYEALAEGLYKKRGLDVHIMEGGPAVNVPELLAGGAADFGIGSNAFIPINMMREGAHVKAVMAIFQKDPQVLLTHPRKDVKTLADMKGKPIMISDATISAFWPWLKAKFGFDDSQIRKYTFNLAPFLVDPKAIQEGYLSSEPYTIEKQTGIAPQIFLLADNGYPGYANMVLVPQHWIDTNPKAVQAFVDATAQGWRDYLTGDPKPGNMLIKRDNPEMTDDIIAEAIDKMKSYGIVISGDAQTAGIGAMTDARWKEFFDTMASLGMYNKSLDYRKAYDLRFIDKAAKN